MSGVEQMTDTELWNDMMKFQRLAQELQDNTFCVIAAGLERAYRNRFGSTVPTGDRKVEEYKG